MALESIVIIKIVLDFHSSLNMNSLFYLKLKLPETRSKT